MNPAAFIISDTPRFSILNIGLGANFDLYNYYNIYNTLSANSNDLASLTPDQWKKIMNLSANISLTGPLTIGYIWDGIGILLYDNALVSMITRQDLGIPVINFGTYLDIGALVGFGFKIPMPVFMGKFTKAYGGISIKYINRFKYENPRLSLLELLDVGTGLMSFQKGFLWGQAIGSDVGFLVRAEEWSYGFVVRDWFTTQFSWNEYSADFKQINTNALPTTSFSPALDLGGSYRIKTILPQYYISDLTFYLDLANSIDFTENYLLKIRFGTEISLFNFLKLRGGIYKGYPTIGVGVVTSFLTINAAYYTEEYGDFPGSMPQQNYTLELHFIL
jgi:hypothetical protein